MDVHSPEIRSFNMSQIKNKNTKPEELVRHFLFINGFRYRKNVKKLPGSPDIVLPRYQTVIFINGCFWHGHQGCKYFVMPKTNVEFWEKKIQGNIKRDKCNYEKLDKAGWHVITVWECQLKPKLKEETLNSLRHTIKAYLKD